MSTKWHEGPLRAFDTETLSVDPTTSRIVTAAVVDVIPGQRPRDLQWVIDPDQDIPTEASDIHGWTNDRIARELNGAQAARIRGSVMEGGVLEPITREVALFEMAMLLGQAMGAGVPVVAANAAFDLTLLEAELERNGIPTLASRPSGITGVVDPMVIDKQHDPYRKVCYKAPGCDRENKHHECGGCRGGKVRCGGCGAIDRTLSGLCLHYNVRLTAAHDAGADALAAARLVPKVAAAWPQVARLLLPTIHADQVKWKREQMVGLADWFRKQGEPEKAATCNPGWPLQAPQVETVAVQGSLL